MTITDSTQALALGALVLALCAMMLSLVAVAIANAARVSARHAVETAATARWHVGPTQEQSTTEWAAEAVADAEQQQVPEETEPAPEWLPPVLRLVEAPPMTPQARVAAMLDALTSQESGEVTLPDSVLHHLSTEEHLAMNAALLEVARLGGRLLEARDDVVERSLHIRWTTPQ